MDLIPILKQIAVPRPNYSDAVDGTASFLMHLLRGWGIDYQVQEFYLRPWVMLILAITILALSILFALAIIKKRPVIALSFAVAVPLLLVLEFELFVPVVSWIGGKQGKNIVVEYRAPAPAREIVFMAHYDSKSDFWDHEQRAKVYRFMPAFFILAIALALWTFAVRRRESLGRGAPRAAAVALASLYVVYICLVALGFGGFVLVSDRHSSPGTVDNASSVTALLALAKDVKDGKVPIGSSNITIVLTGGEEVNLQGAHHYLRERINRGLDKSIPLSMVNLELAGQPGNLSYARKDGVFLKYFTPDQDLVAKAGLAWKAVSGRDISEGETITDDAQRFLAAGIPAITIGHDGLPGPGFGGLHCEMDDMSRVDGKNLELMVRMIEKFVTSL
jgi:hypothetical protein